MSEKGLYNRADVAGKLAVSLAIPPNMLQFGCGHVRVLPKSCLMAVWMKLNVNAIDSTYLAGVEKKIPYEYHHEIKAYGKAFTQTLKDAGMHAAFTADIKY